LAVRHPTEVAFDVHCVLAPTAEHETVAPFEQVVSAVQSFTKRPKVREKGCCPLEVGGTTRSVPAAFESFSDARPFSQRDIEHDPPRLLEHEPRVSAIVTPSSTDTFMPRMQRNARTVNLIMLLTFPAPAHRYRP
jgi:hypothetical protein